MIRLISELTEHQVEVLVESDATTGKKGYFLEGIFMQSESKNRNGRIYPKGVMESAVARYIEEKVSIKTAYGEFGHPQGPKINETLISHLIEKLEWHGNDVIGRAKVFSQGSGAIVRGIMEDGGQLGMSSRGLGSLKKTNEAMVVQDDYWLATAADIVVDPSAHKAFVNGIMEGLEWVNESGVWTAKKIEETREELDPVFAIRDREERETKFIAAFERFLADIRK